VKFTKIFRILTLAVILSLLLVAIPASPALAYDYDIELDPDEGEIDGYFYVEGDDWPKSIYEPTVIIKEVDIYLSSEDVDTGDEIDDEVTIYEKLKSGYDIDDDGEFRARVKVPAELTDGDEDEDVHRGTYYVYVTMKGDDEIDAVAEFTVIYAEITLDPDEGVVGTEVEITGIDFANREDITIEYDDVEEDIESGEDETGSDGGFECFILIPESTAGEHTITVSDGTSEAEATFTVEPEIAVSPDEGEAGDLVEVTGTGFGDEVNVDITLNGTLNGVGGVTVDTNEDGSFAAHLEVPDVAEGSYDIEADDGDNDAKVNFTVYTAIEAGISPVTSQDSPGHVGMNITISGLGFEPNSTITITYATEPIVVKTVISDLDGAFTATFKVPESAPGTHIITASDGINTLTSTFVMESEAPPIPQPLLPKMDTKAESLTEFDWEAVTDDSLPVTYTLQVATDEDFTSASIVLAKVGLPGSDYTLTEGEKLDPTKKEEPYYWRVKAIDGAFNESQWSAPGSFYVGGLFFPGWITHLWWGLGALGAGFLGYYLGKRRAYYSY
jgi:hypothetical protein